MNRLVIILLVIFLPIESYSQIEISRYHSPSFSKDVYCDTINIDKCYITIDGVKIATDTNAREEIENMFTVVRTIPLGRYYNMLRVEQTDTLYIVYDSTVVNDSLVYLTDTLHSTKLYSVLIENNEVDNGNEYEVGKSISLHLQSYYNKLGSFNVCKKNGSNEEPATTWTCDQCQVVILHGKEVKCYDCPLYNNLYHIISVH
jgi:hypothetical protein